jgi:hypothetical protein
MHNASLRSNRSGYGGAIAIGGAVLEAANIEIWNNQAQTGGAIFVGAGGELILSGATIGGNVSTNSDPFFSGVIHINWDEPVLITNSIIWGNTPRAFGAHHLPEQFVLNNVIVQGGCPEWGVTIIATCTDVQSANPVFRDLPGGDLRLGSGSPAIDAGTNVFLGMDIFDLNRNGNTSEPIPFDVAGLRRIVDWAGTGTARVDLGAHETQR